MAPPFGGRFVLWLAGLLGIVILSSLLAGTLIFIVIAAAVGWIAWLIGRLLGFRSSAPPRMMFGRAGAMGPNGPSRRPGADATGTRGPSGGPIIDVDGHEVEREPEAAPASPSRAETDLDDDSLDAEADAEEPFIATVEGPDDDE